eukprot:SAG31_NODE_312_length_17856_cov_14.557827_6_plen_101_part_00
MPTRRRDDLVRSLSAGTALRSAAMVRMYALPLCLFLVHYAGRRRLAAIAMMGTSWCKVVNTEAKRLAQTSAQAWAGKAAATLTVLTVQHANARPVAPQIV